MSSDNVIQLPRGSGSPRPAREDRDWSTGLELVADVGITYRQLDYWTRTGLLNTITVNDPGSGHLRAYANTEIARARAVRELLDAGMTLQTIRQIVDQFVTDGQAVLGPITITHTEGAAS